MKFLPVFILILNGINGQFLPVILSINPEIVTCWKRVESYIKSCESKVIKDWSINQAQIDSSPIGKRGCCADWDLQDCVVKAAEEVCTEKAAFFLNDEMIMWRNIWLTSNRTCDYYPYGSTKCHFPIWGIVLVIISVLVICIISATEFIFYRRSRQNNIDILSQRGFSETD